MRFIPAVSLVQIQLQPPPGPVVKRLRHRPFTAVTRVRFPSGSPTPLRGMTGHTRYGGIAQLVERPPHTRKVTDSSSVVSTRKTVTPNGVAVFLFPGMERDRQFGGRPPPTGQVTDSSFVVSTRKQSRQTAWLFSGTQRDGQFGRQSPPKKYLRPKVLGASVFCRKGEAGGCGGDGTLWKKMIKTPPDKLNLF